MTSARAYVGSSGVGRRDGSALMRPPPSRRSRARTPSRAARTAAWSFGTMPPSNAPSPSELVGVVGAIERRRALEKTPGTSVTNRMRSAPSPTASAAAASSAFTFSGPARERGDDRDAPGRERLDDRLRARAARRRRRARAPAPASPRGRSRRRRAPTARGPIAAHSARVDREQRLADDRKRRRRRDAAAADERDLEPAARHLRGDLRPGAVDDADRVPGARAQPDRRGAARPRRRPSRRALTSCTPR